MMGSRAALHCKPGIIRKGNQSYQKVNVYNVKERKSPTM